MCRGIFLPDKERHKGTKLPDKPSDNGWEWVISPELSLSLDNNPKLKYWQMPYTLYYGKELIGYIVFDLSVNSTVFRKQL